MLSVDEALAIVLDHARPLPARVSTLDDALGRVLAEKIASDVDSPPHDKAIVDGYAVVAAAVRSPDDRLRVIEEVTAGQVPQRAVEPGTATRIMTGAPIPDGADAVVMVEKSRLMATAGQALVQILEVPVRPGQNIARRGTSLERGQVVLQPGQRLRGIEIGLLAEVGRSSIEVIRQPLVAVLPTGNEIVPASQTPAPGQIRNSNGPMLEALSHSAGAHARQLPIAPDDPDQLRALISSAFGSDILILSGGVSAGVLDLVPSALAELGVEQVFHKVNLKPGKPLWFGVRRHSQPLRETLVFGLPGNPVSTLVCFELFVRPAIEKLSGRQPAGLPRIAARLTHEHLQRGDRPTYWPAALCIAEGGQRITLLPWKGSGDLRTLTDADALAILPAGERVFGVGAEIEALRL